MSEAAKSNYHGKRAIKQKEVAEFTRKEKETQQAMGYEAMEGGIPPPGMVDSMLKEFVVVRLG